MGSNIEPIPRTLKPPQRTRLHNVFGSGSTFPYLLTYTFPLPMSQLKIHRYPFRQWRRNQWSCQVSDSKRDVKQAPNLSTQLARPASSTRPRLSKSSSPASLIEPCFPITYFCFERRTPVAFFPMAWMGVLNKIYIGVIIYLFRRQMMIESRLALRKNILSS